MAVEGNLIVIVMPEYIAPVTKRLINNIDQQTGQNGNLIQTGNLNAQLGPQGQAGVMQPNDGMSNLVPTPAQLTTPPQLPPRSDRVISNHMKSSGDETANMALGIPHGNVIILESLCATLRSIIDFSKSPKAKLITSTSTISMEWRERITASLYTISIILEQLHYILRYAKKMIESLPDKILKFLHDRTHCIVLNPCIKSPTDFNTSTLQNITNKTSAEIKGILLNSIETQMAMANLLTEFVNKHFGQLNVSEYFNRINYSIDGDTPKKGSHSIINSSIIMKNSQDIQLRPDRFGTIRKTIDLPYGGLLIGSHASPMNIAKSNELSPLINEVSTIRGFKVILDDRRKQFSSKRQAYLTNLDLINMILKHIDTNILFTYDNTVDPPITQDNNTDPNVLNDEKKYLSNKIEFPSLPTDVKDNITLLDSNGETVIIADMIDILQAIFNGFNSAPQIIVNNRPEKIFYITHLYRRNGDNPGIQITYNVAME